MKILEELWLNNISSSQDVRANSELSNIKALVKKNEERLCAELQKEQKEKFELLKDSSEELSSLLQQQAFAAGFSLAVKIMMEVMETAEIPSMDD